MRAGCSLQWDLLKAQEEAKRSGKKGGQLEKDKQVLDKFRERAGPSLRQLAVSFLSLSFSTMVELYSSIYDDANTAYE